MSIVKSNSYYCSAETYFSEELVLTYLFTQSISHQHLNWTLILYIFWFIRLCSPWIVRHVLQKQGCILRLPQSQTPLMNRTDPLIFLTPFPSPIWRTFSPISELFLLYFNIWLPLSASVKTISCEIENNHVERDWAGSSLSSSPLLSMESWLLLLKSTKDWTITQ